MNINQPEPELSALTENKSKRGNTLQTKALGRKKTSLGKWLLKQVTLLTVIVIAGIAIGAWLLYTVNSFFESNKFEFHQPVQFQKPIRIVPRQVAREVMNLIPEAKAENLDPKPEASISPDEKNGSSEATEQIVRAIYRLESSGGLNDGCKRKGLFNGYGFRQNSREFKCFETVAEVKTLVTDWVEDKKAKGMSTPELLCYYNRGLKLSDCEYYQKYLIVK